MRRFTWLMLGSLFVFVAIACNRAKPADSQFRPTATNVSNTSVRSAGPFFSHGM